MHTNPSPSHRIEETFQYIQVLLDSAMEEIAHNDRFQHTPYDWSFIQQQVHNLDTEIGRLNQDPSQKDTCVPFLHRIEYMYLFMNETRTHARVSLSPPPLFRRLEKRTTSTSTHDTCSLCSCSFTFQDRFTKTYLSCTHRFHEQCICEWSTEHELCPICDTNMYILNT